MQTLQDGFPTFHSHARYNTSQDPHWLASCTQTLSAQAFTLALRDRLYIPEIWISGTCPGCHHDMPQLSLSHHATCSLNVTARHNLVRDMIARHARLSLGSAFVSVETPNLDPNSQARPADVLLIPPNKINHLRPVAFDVTIVTACSLADARAHKHATPNAHILLQNGIEFIPLVFNPLAHTDYITRDTLLKISNAPPGPNGVMHDITITILNALADMYIKRDTIRTFLNAVAAATSAAGPTAAHPFNPPPAPPPPPPPLPPPSAPAANAA